MIFYILSHRARIIMGFLELRIGAARLPDAYWENGRRRTMRLPMRNVVCNRFAERGDGIKIDNYVRSKYAPLSLIKRSHYRYLTLNGAEVALPNRKAEWRTPGGQIRVFVVATVSSRRHPDSPVETNVLPIEIGVSAEFEHQTPKFLWFAEPLWEGYRGG